MNFILYSHINQASIDKNLGLPEYSYYFVLKEFQLAFEQLGKVILIQDPFTDVEPIYEQCRSQGEDCIFVCFSPPNKAPVGLSCPVVCVFAWEFNNLPNEVWDGDPRNDWRNVLAEHGRTITLAEYSAAAVRDSMGEDYPVVAIPVPVWSRFSKVRPCTPIVKPTPLEVAGHIVDSRLYTINVDTITLNKPERCFLFPAWDGKTLNMDCSLGGGGDGYLVGFYESEGWGTWSKTDEPWILLPCRIEGDIFLSLIARGYGHNAKRNIFIRVGDRIQEIFLSENFDRHELQFHLRAPVTKIQILGLDLTPVEQLSHQRTMGIGIEGFTIEKGVAPEGSSEPRLQLSEDESEFSFKAQAPELSHLVGFHYGESWGTWSRAVSPSILLGRELVGHTRVEFTAMGFGANAGREIGVQFGEQSKTIKLAKRAKTYTLDFDAVLPAEVLRFHGLDVSPREGAADDRVLGMGISQLRISGGKGSLPAVVLAENTNRLNTYFSGVVYTSVFNPGDSRKNWQDMLIAFVYTFRDVADATLILKVTHRSIASYLGIFHYYPQRLAPFKCRVVLIHGFLDDDAYQRLINASSYYVNTSHCEGLCLPLMEFMACGKPGIAPRHTSMADYVSKDSNFVIDSTVEPGIWPHDSRDVFRALRYRLDWWSLANCYKESYRVAKQEVPRYEAMSATGVERMKNFCSIERTRDLLADFFSSELKRSSNTES